ncbi:MAG: WhiB family transcriptional regulator [Pseudonocardia sp.]|mgnify:CR=1 FL=1|nr:WhiB family transcriptional regulator [Pseudonocardia sp.]
MTAATTRPTTREGVGSHVQPGDFRHRAACRSVDPEIFFPAALSGDEYETQVSIAKAVCAGCPVLADCLEWALSGLPDGIAGGMTEHERRAEQARRRGGRSRGGRLPRPRPPRRPAAGNRREVAAAGRAAIASGMSVDEAAGEFRVSLRTAARWAVAVHASQTGEEGRAGCNRRALEISHTETQAGTRAEGLDRR